MDYKHASDWELWQYCRQGNIRAYNELFYRYSTRLYRQAARYILNDTVAEELMLDLFFDLWNKRQERTIEGNFSAYIYCCMRNKIVDYRRKAIPVMTSIEQTTLTETLEDIRQADHESMSTDAAEIYDKVLKTMSPQRRKVFQLSREEELTYPEIAREMNLSINTVENYMSSALDTFRKRTKGYLSTTDHILYLFLIGHLFL